MWDVIDTPHEQSNVFKAAGILCSPPLLISAYNNDHRHCALLKWWHEKEHADIGTSPAASFALVFLIPSVLGSLILSTPIILAPVIPIQVQCPMVIGPLIPIVRKPSHGGPCSVPAVPV